MVGVEGPGAEVGRREDRQQARKGVSKVAVMMWTVGLK
jgi:hypothetical protein